MNNCANCQPGEPCRLHRVVADGKSVRVPLTMMDGMQRELHDRLLRTNEPHQYAAAIRDEATKRDQIQAHADHWSEHFAAVAEAKAKDPSYQTYANGRG